MGMAAILFNGVKLFEQIVNSLSTEGVCVCVLGVGVGVGGLNQFSSRETLLLILTQLQITSIYSVCIGVLYLICESQQTGQNKKTSPPPPPHTHTHTYTPTHT